MINIMKRKFEIFLSSERGKRILNRFYSWGAACVILGALMEILRIPYGDLVLCISMLVEFAVFFISGFEKPESSYNWENVFPELKSNNPIDIKDGVVDRKRESSNVHSEIYDKIIKELDGLSSSINSLEKSIGAIKSNGTNGSMNINSVDLSENSKQYVTEIEYLINNIKDLNNLYQLQIRSITSHIANVEIMNDNLRNLSSTYSNSNMIKQENELMVAQLKEINAAYSRLLNALTINNVTNNQNI